MRINKNHIYLIQICDHSSVLYSMEDGFSNLTEILTEAKHQCKSKESWKAVKTIWVNDKTAKETTAYKVSGNKLVKA